MLYKLLPISYIPIPDISSLQKSSLHNTSDKENFHLSNCEIQNKVCDPTEKDTNTDLKNKLISYL